MIYIFLRNIFTKIDFLFRNKNTDLFSFEKLCNAIPNLAKIRSVRRGSQAGCII